MPAEYIHHPEPGLPVGIQQDAVEVFGRAGNDVGLKLLVGGDISVIYVVDRGKEILAAFDSCGGYGVRKAPVDNNSVLFDSRIELAPAVQEQLFIIGGVGDVRGNHCQDLGLVRLG
jgi:hypothetical protein